MPFPSVFGSLWTPHRAAAWTALFLFLLTASAYFCGVNAKRALQHAVFIVPFIALWLLIPIRKSTWVRPSTFDRGMPVEQRR